MFVSALASPSLQSSASSLLSFAPWLRAPQGVLTPVYRVASIIPGELHSVAQDPWKGLPPSGPCGRSQILAFISLAHLFSENFDQLFPKKKQFIPKLAFPDTNLSFNRNRKNFFCSVPICFECFLPYIPHCRATHEVLPFQLSILEKLEITLL